MRHLIAWGGAAAVVVAIYFAISTSDSSTAAVGWLALPVLVAWWIGCVYLTARVLRDRVNGRGIATTDGALLALLVLTPIVAIGADAVVSEADHTATVQPVDPGPGGTAIEVFDGSPGHYRCPRFTNGIYVADQVAVYGVTCAEAQKLMTHALAVAPRPGFAGSWAADGYAWTLTTNNGIRLEGAQAASDGSARQIGAQLTRL